MSIFSWTDVSFHDLLENVLKQECDCCWAISIIRQFIAMLRFERGFHESLSIQYLINAIPRIQINYKGGILMLENAGVFLRDEGTVLDKVCPLTYKVDLIPKPLPGGEQKFKISSFEVRKPSHYADDQSRFETDLVDHLRTRGPVAAAIPAFPSYSNLNGFNKAYKPTQSEINDFLSGKKIHFHCMLLTGYGIDENGVEYWEFQDSNGVLWGEKGFVKVSRRIGIVLLFILMELEPIDLSDMDVDLSDMEM